MSDNTDDILDRDPVADNETSTNTDTDDSTGDEAAATGTETNDQTTVPETTVPNSLTDADEDDTHPGGPCRHEALDSVNKPVTREDESARDVELCEERRYRGVHAAEVSGQSGFEASDSRRSQERHEEDRQPDPRDEQPDTECHADDETDEVHESEREREGEIQEILVRLYPEGSTETSPKNHSERRRSRSRRLAVGGIRGHHV